MTISQALIAGKMIKSSKTIAVPFVIQLKYTGFGDLPIKANIEQRIMNQIKIPDKNMKTIVNLE